jgi:hypothetical protein
MKKSYTLFIISIIVCIYSCNNNPVVGPTNPTLNQHDTVLFQTLDSFGLYINGIDTITADSTSFYFSVQGQNDIVLTYMGETDHPQSTTITDSAADVIVVMGDSASTMQAEDVHTVVFEFIDSTHLAGQQVLDTYRHSQLRFAQILIKLRINHNQNYGNGLYFIRLRNLKFYRVT